MVRRRQWSNYVFAGLFGVALILFTRVMLPFLMPVLLGAFLVVLFMPLQDLFTGRFHLSPTTSAGLSTASVFLVLLLPLGVAGYLVSRELLDLMAYAQELLDRTDIRMELVSRLPSGFRHYVRLEDPTGQRMEDAVLGVLANSGAVLTSIVSATTEFAADVFLMVVAMFYFFLDGRRLFQEARRTVPLEPRYVTAFAKEFQDVANAMIYGTALTGLLQGLTGYLGLLIAQVPHAHVWAVAMVAVAFIPLGGTALVWAPVGVGLILTHHVGQGVFLIAWGILMVGLADNLLRPKLCSSRLTLHPLLVFLSMFGGFAVFGMMGILVGPLIASLFMAMVRIYRRDFLGLKPLPPPPHALPAEAAIPAPILVGSAAQS